MMPEDTTAHKGHSTLLGYTATLIAFVLLDAAWLALFAIEMFKHAVGPILREQPDILAAVAFYLIYAAGLFALAVRPAAVSHSLRMAITNGAIVGLTAYATFDLTNLAVIQGWTPAIVLMDMAWGAAASATAAALGYVGATQRRA
jgi:uncharacterized membrane protein